MKRCCFVALAVYLTITCFINVCSAQNGSFTNDEKSRIKELFTTLHNFIKEKDSAGMRITLKDFIIPQQSSYRTRLDEMKNIVSLIASRLKDAQDYDKISSFIAYQPKGKGKEKNLDDLKELLPNLLDHVFKRIDNYSYAADTDKDLLNRLIAYIVDTAKNISIEDIEISRTFGIGNENSGKTIENKLFFGLLNGVLKIFEMMDKSPINPFKSIEISFSPSAKTLGWAETPKSTLRRSLLYENKPQSVNDTLNNLPGDKNGQFDDNPHLTEKQIMENFKKYVRNYLETERQKLPNTRKSLSSNFQAALSNIPNAIKSMADNHRNTIQTKLGKTNVPENKLNGQEGSSFLNNLSKIIESIAKNTEAPEDGQNQIDPSARGLFETPDSNDRNTQYDDDDEDVDLNYRIGSLEGDYGDYFDDDQLSSRINIDDETDQEFENYPVTELSKRRSTETDQLFDPDINTASDALPERKSAVLDKPLDQIETNIQLPAEKIATIKEALPKRKSAETDTTTQNAADEKLPKITSTEIDAATDKQPERKSAEAIQLPENISDNPEAVTENLPDEESNKAEAPSVRIKLPPKMPLPDLETLPSISSHSLDDCYGVHDHGLSSYHINNLLDEDINRMHGSFGFGHLGFPGFPGYSRNVIRPPLGIMPPFIPSFKGFSGTFIPPMRHPYHHIRGMFKLPFMRPRGHLSIDHIIPSVIPAPVILDQVIHEPVIPNPFMEFPKITPPVIPSFDSVEPTSSFITPNTDDNNDNINISSNDNNNHNSLGNTESSSFIPEMPPVIDIPTPVSNPLNKKIGRRNNEELNDTKMVKPLNFSRRNMPELTIKPDEIEISTNVIPVEHYYGISRRGLPKIILLLPKHPTPREQELPFLLKQFLLEFYKSSSGDYISSSILRHNLGDDKKTNQNESKNYITFRRHMIVDVKPNISDIVDENLNNTLDSNTTVPSRKSSDEPLQSDSDEAPQNISDNVTKNDTNDDTTNDDTVSNIALRRNIEDDASEKPGENVDNSTNETNESTTILPLRKNTDQVDKIEDKTLEPSSDVASRKSIDSNNKSYDKELESNAEHTTVAPSKNDTEISLRRSGELEKSAPIIKPDESQIFVPTGNDFDSKTKLFIIQPKENEDDNLPHLIKEFLKDHRKETRKSMNTENNNLNPNLDPAMTDKDSEASDAVPRINTVSMPKLNETIPNTRRNNSNTNINLSVNNLGIIDVRQKKFQNKLVKEIVDSLKDIQISTQPLPKLRYGKSATRRLIGGTEIQETLEKEFEESKSTTEADIDLSRRSLLKESTEEQKVTLVPFASVVSTVGTVTDLFPQNIKDPTQSNSAGKASMDKIKKEHMKIHNKVIDNVFSTISHMSTKQMEPTTISTFVTKLPSGSDTKAFVSGSRRAFTGEIQSTTKKAYPRLLLIQPDEFESKEDLHGLLRKFINNYHQKRKKNGINITGKNNGNTRRNSNANGEVISVRSSFPTIGDKKDTNEKNKTQIHFSTPELDIFDLRDK